MPQFTLKLRHHFRLYKKERLSSKLGTIIKTFKKKLEKNLLCWKFARKQFLSARLLFCFVFCFLFLFFLFVSAVFSVSIYSVNTLCASVYELVYFHVRMCTCVCVKQSLTKPKLFILYVYAATIDVVLCTVLFGSVRWLCVIICLCGSSVLAVCDYLCVTLCVSLSNF